MNLIIVFTPEAWDYAKEHADTMHITQTYCKQCGGHVRLAPVLNLGEPDNKEDFEEHSKENVRVFVANSIPQNPPKILIQLRTNTRPPVLVASRRR